MRGGPTAGQLESPSGLDVRDLESSRKLTGQLGCQPTDLCLCILAPESAKNTKNEGRHTLTRRTDRPIFRHSCDHTLSLIHI